MRHARPLLPLVCFALAGLAFAGAGLAQTAPPPEGSTPPPDTEIVAEATVPASRLIASYTELAGSEANARALIEGLRNGTEISLNSEVTTTTTVTNADGTTSTQTSTSTVATAIVPATGKMGWGEVNLTLALAQALAGPDATAEQLQVALNGGTVTQADGTTATVDGVLQLRAGGMGWGQIGKQLGFNVGTLMSGKTRVAASEPAAGADAATTASAKVAKSAKADKATRPVARVERAAKVERPTRPERAAKVDRPERPALPERPNRGR